MRRKRPLIAAPILALVAFSLAGEVPATAADHASAVEIGTFDNPTYVTVAPGQPRLLFVVERPGQIQVLVDERRRDRPFLDIRNFVRGMPDPGAGGEQGLLSMAFPPDYESSGRFYVAFTNNNGSLEIDEFTRSPNSLRAAVKSRRVVLVIPHPGAENHNGGQLQFDADGLLYISTGDGGAVDPRGEPARKLDNLLGKILRIDPRPSASHPYQIPAGNPFIGRYGRDQIFAYGLRHPYRFTLDGPRIAIGDVGQGLREEVNFLNLSDAAGANFGWPQFEGDLVFDNTRPGPHPPTFPMFTYSHGRGRCAIIGGYVVRDQTQTVLLGRYIYGDTCTGQIRSFVPRVAEQKAVGDRPTGLVLPGLTSFGEGFNGKLYAAQLGGQVWRLEPPAP